MSHFLSLLHNTLLHNMSCTVLHRTVSKFESQSFRAEMLIVLLLSKNQYQIKLQLQMTHFHTILQSDFNYKWLREVGAAFGDVQEVKQGHLTHTRLYPGEQERYPWCKISDSLGQILPIVSCGFEGAKIRDESGVLSVHITALAQGYSIFKAWLPQKVRTKKALIHQLFKATCVQKLDLIIYLFNYTDQE